MPTSSGGPRETAETRGCALTRPPERSIIVPATTDARAPAMTLDDSSPRMPPDPAGWTRRDVLRLAAAGTVGGAGLQSESAWCAGTGGEPLEIGTGPQLFLDDH